MMQEIELNDTYEDEEEGGDEEEAEEETQEIEETDFSRMQSYKDIVNDTYAKFKRIESTIKWTLSGNIHHNEEKTIYKVERMMECSAFRLFKMCSDVSYETKSQWDNRDIELIDIQCRETYEKIQLVQSEWKFPWMWSKIRNIVGLQWHSYNNIKNTYTILFNTCEHDLYVPKEDQVKANISYSIWIKHINNSKCFMTFCIDLSLEKTYNPFLMHSKMSSVLSTRHQIYNISDDAYNSIYEKWMCILCKKTNDCYLLECRYCTIARYWKCLNVGCKKSQPKINDTDRCYYCDKLKGK